MLVSKKLRFYWWLLKGVLARHSKLIIVTFVVSLLAFVLALTSIPLIRAELRSDAQVIGIVGQYTPTNLPLDIQRLVSRGLTEVTESGDIVPALSEKWEVSDEGKKYTFTLKPGIIWHDEKEFVASDINYNLKDVEFVPTDEVTLVVKLKEPFTPLPNFLSKPLFRKGLVGVGDYKIDGIRLKGEYVSYLKLLPVDPTDPPMEFKFFASEPTAKTAFKLGEVNYLSEVVDPAPFTEWKNVTVTEGQKHNQFVGIFFNTTNQFLQDKEVRQALSFAVEKPEKNRINSPISSKSWAYTTRVKQYEKDDEEAKKLLGTENVPTDQHVTLSTFPQYFSLAQTIAAAWEGVGIKTTIKVENGMPSEYDALLATQEIPLDPDQYTLWHSTQAETNLAKYASPRIDKLLEDGRKEPDQEARKAIYFDFQRFLVDDAPAVFLFHPTTYTIARK